MPVFNGASHFESALQSVLSQSYPATEIIIVDGGSTDGTLALLEQYDRHVHHWTSEPDEGMYDAINKGIAACRGSVIKVLNADDELTPGSVSIAVRALDGRPRALIRGNLDLIDDTGRVLATWTSANKASFLPSDFPLLHPTWYLPRAVYEELGLYHRRYRIAADTDFFYRLLRADVQIHHLDESLVRFREGGMSAQYGGLAESLEIHGRYIGRGRAAYAVARRGLQKARSRALRGLIGDRGYAALRRIFRPSDRPSRRRGGGAT